jgi:hypothetical protein
MFANINTRIHATFWLISIISKEEDKLKLEKCHVTIYNIVQCGNRLLGGNFQNWLCEVLFSNMFVISVGCGNSSGGDLVHLQRLFYVGEETELSLKISIMA